MPLSHLFVKCIWYVLFLDDMLHCCSTSRETLLRLGSNRFGTQRIRELPPDQRYTWSLNCEAIRYMLWIHTFLHSMKLQLVLHLLRSCSVHPTQALHSQQLLQYFCWILLADDAEEAITFLASPLPASASGPPMQLSNS